MNKFICPACNVDQMYGSNLNKHLSTCIKYQEFIKKYTPLKGYKCPNCSKVFIDDIFIKDHINKYCQNST